MSNEILRFKTIADYMQAFGLAARTPLCEVIDFSQGLHMLSANRMIADFYCIFLKDVHCGDMIYGRQTYDYQAGTLVFLAPGQLYGFRNVDPTIKPKGYGLLFHPDLIRGTELMRRMKDYTFFSYDTREALHLSDDERANILHCLHNIDAELSHADAHSHRLIVSTIELLLDYSLRFYDRQFSTRHEVNSDVLSRFESMLSDYVLSGRARREGQPSVKTCATALNLSPNYFGDLIKRETGMSASSHIHSYLIGLAKDRIFDPTLSISEIAYDLGFQYPQHFSRLFKKSTGLSPKQYRELKN